MDVLRGIRSVRAESAAEVLPVTWEAAESAGARFFDGHARLVVHLGVAAGRDEVCLERTARNVAEGVDNLGKRADGPLDDGRDRVTTALDVDRLLEELCDRWPGAVRISDDCGRYVCNATLRASLRGAPPGRTALFVHVPMLSPEAATSLGVALAGALDAVTRVW